ncbi:MAG: hypothetical protein RSD77_06595 [Romboutsia sp.]
MEGKISLLLDKIWTVPIAISSASALIIIKYISIIHSDKLDKVSNTLSSISVATLGIYITHVIIINKLNQTI